MSRSQMLVLPWLALGGAVALASTVDWVEPPAAPLEIERGPAAVWNTAVTLEEAPVTPPRVRARAARVTPAVHSRGEAAARNQGLRWEQLARDERPAPDVAGLAHDARLERMETELRQVVSLSNTDPGAAALRLGNRARAMVLEVSRLRHMGANAAQVDELCASVEELRTRADLELEAR